MPESSEICKIRILSEEYMDFIFEKSRPNVFDGATEEQLCTQSLGFFYDAVYIDRTFVGPLSMDRFSYGEIPKCYALLDTETLSQAGIAQVQNYPTLQLKGNRVLIGFLDTGIDYGNPIFRNLDGATRIAAIWDQTVQSGSPPEGFLYGSEYVREEIDRALRSGAPEEIVPSRDTNGHGTFVASVAAGGVDEGTRFSGAAPESTIAVVKLKEAKQYLKDYYLIAGGEPCYQENDIMLGVRYLDELAGRLGLPLVMCITLGTNMGDHTGSSPLASYLNSFAAINNRILVTGTGNEANQRHHYEGRLEDRGDADTVEVRVEKGAAGFTAELWTDIPNILVLSVTSPSGETIPYATIRQGQSAVYRFVLEKTTLYLDYRILVRNTNAELIFLRFENPVEGVWKIRVEGTQIADGIFHIWLPVKEFLSGEVYFLTPNPNTTITEPSNGFVPITAANYNGANNALAVESGRGYTRSRRIKPDFAAPGISVTGANLQRGFSERSGSSVAVAVTAGAAALFEEWLVYHLGVTDTNSLQVKNLLIYGARRMEGETYPNREWGYGMLDLYQTLLALREL